jgi:hypothetical protein
MSDHTRSNRIAEVLDHIDHLTFDDSYGEAIREATTELRTLILAQDQAEPESSLSLVLEAIRHDIRHKAPGATWASIWTDEWDNGYFFSLAAVTITSEAGAVATLDLDLDNWAADLTEFFGPVGRDTLLVLNLDTLATELTNTYAAQEARP